jgi:hypothetical protein
MFLPVFVYGVYRQIHPAEYRGYLFYGFMVSVMVPVEIFGPLNLKLRIGFNEREPQVERIMLVVRH